MSNEEREQKISLYFEMWVTGNFDGLEDIFDPGIYYSECYGPEYKGIAEIRLWIDEMLRKQTVLEWTIKQFVHQDNTTVVEWFFKEVTDGKENDFDGVSIIEFGDKMISVKEFASESNHTTPFRNE